MEQKMTMKDALRIMQDELRQINIPAEHVFSIGVHVGRALGIIEDCITSIDREEMMRMQEQQKLDAIDFGNAPAEPQEEEIVPEEVAEEAGGENA